MPPIPQLVGGRGEVQLKAARLQNLTSWLCPPKKCQLLRITVSTQCDKKLIVTKYSRLPPRQGVEVGGDEAM